MKKVILLIAMAVFCIIAAFECAPIQSGNIYKKECWEPDKYILYISEYQRGNIRRAAYLVPEETYKTYRVGQYFRLEDVRQDD